MAVAHRPARPEHGPALSATQARAGRPGVHILWILVVSTGLAAVALLAILAFNAPGLSGPGGQTSPEKPTISATPSPVKQTTAG
jgi:hypothetical protein